VVVHPDADTLAAGIAARLVTALLDAQSERGWTDLVLTGGGIGGASLRAVRGCAAARALDWGAVGVWWGDERFLADGDPDRNATQAWVDLLDGVGVARSQVHEMGSRSLHPDAQSAAEGYARALAAAAPAGAEMPDVDVLLLGVGPEGHVASLFPGAPGLAASGTVVAVTDSPKPPPVRISLTLGAIRSARQVWLLASGAEKAEAVARSLSGIEAAQCPAAGARGREATLYLLDTAAASALHAAG
jgi:6-phosphogluconolactonase